LFCCLMVHGAFRHNDHLMSSLRALQNEFRPTLRLSLPLVLAEIGCMTM